MKLSYNDLLLKILSIINYQDRENFVKEVEQEIHVEAMANCIGKLPQSAQEEIIAKASNKEVVEKYITKDNLIEEINNVSTKTLADFLQYLTPSLNDNQKEQIAAAFPH
jgi:hypothetical protein